MGAAIVPLLRLLGNKLDPSSTNKQPKTYYLLSFANGQSDLIRCLYLFSFVSTIMDFMLILEIFEKIE